LFSPADALAAWDLTGPAETSPDAGLINHTFLVGKPPEAVLQWLNPIFSPAVNLDIEAVTARLAAKGLVTPRVLPTRSGSSYLVDGEASWRMLSFVPGRTVHHVGSPQMAFEAGRLVGQFHAALDGWAHPQNAPRRDAHDTPVRMGELRAALEEGDGHPLEVPARSLGRSILGDWAAWEGELDLPERTCHGDLKISNLRFATDSDEAICLIDLDTVGPMPLSCELGDAWRSWCNPAGEDAPDDARFDLPIFKASAEGFLATAPPLAPAERASLVGGVERICLELAGRFCGDALQNSYFREDRGRFPELGAHNLHRARCQLSLARAARAARPACEHILVLAG
jgi:Ser/Thr protein kinase RdoA (MazF antagonist)